MRKILCVLLAVVFVWGSLPVSAETAESVSVSAYAAVLYEPVSGTVLFEKNSREVLQCYHVTGAYTFLVKVSCGSMAQLEHLILQFQKLGTTSTQIILSTPVNHGDLDALML